MLSVNHLIGFGIGDSLPPPDIDLNFLDENQDSLALFDKLAYTNATYIGDDGLLHIVPGNKLLRSQDFSATWTAAAVNQTPNAALSPDGLTNATKVNENATFNVHYYQQSLTNLTPALLYQTLSVYAKAAERNWIALRFVAGGVDHYRTFDVLNGTVGATVAGTYASGIEEVPDYPGWYRCWITVEPTATTSGSVRIHVSDTDSINSYVGVASTGVYLFGAQVNASHELHPYVSTTTVGASLVRLMHEPGTGTRVGLSAATGRTAYVRFNRDMANATRWTATNATVTRDYTGLDGLANKASRVVANADNATVMQTLAGLTTSNRRMTSCFIRRLSGTGTISITQDNGATWVDVTSLIPSDKFAKVYIISAVGMTNAVVGVRLGTSGDSVAIDFWMHTGLSSITPEDSNSEAYVYVDADTQSSGSMLPIISGAAFSSFWNTLEGTVDLNFRAGSAFVSNGSNDVFDAYASSGFSINVRGGPVSSSSTGNVAVSVLFGGPPVAEFVDPANSTSRGDLRNFTFAYATDNCIGFSRLLQGSLPDTSCAIPVVTKMSLLGKADGTTGTVNGYMRRFRYWSKRLTNEEVKNISKE